MNLHNTTRKEVGLGPVAWNENIAAGARTWANACGSDHSPDSIRMYNGILLGENLADGTEGYYDMNKLYVLWDEEKTAWTPGTKVGDEGDAVVGHYTQIVNKNVTEIGCACSKGCKDGNRHCVCRYNPIQLTGDVPY